MRRSRGAGGISPNVTKDNGAVRDFPRAAPFRILLVGNDHAKSILVPELPRRSGEVGEKNSFFSCLGRKMSDGRGYIVGDLHPKGGK